MRQTTSRWKEWGARLRGELRAIALACRDPRTPWYARLLAAGVLAYAASPIDLIPDFIPVLGYVDDLLIVPIGLWLALKMIPEEVIAECRAASRINEEAPPSPSAPRRARAVGGSPRDSARRDAGR